MKPAGIKPNQERKKWNSWNELNNGICRSNEMMAGLISCLFLIDELKSNWRHSVYLIHSIQAAINLPAIPFHEYYNSTLYTWT